MTRRRSTRGKPAAKHETTAERARLDRMSTEHERAQLRLLAAATEDRDAPSQEGDRT